MYDQAAIYTRKSASLHGRCLNNAEQHCWTNNIVSAFNIVRDIALFFFKVPMKRKLSFDYLTLFKINSKNG